MTRSLLLVFSLALAACATAKQARAPGRDCVRYVAQTRQHFGPDGRERSLEVVSVDSVGEADGSFENLYDVCPAGKPPAPALADGLHQWALANQQPGVAAVGAERVGEPERSEDDAGLVVEEKWAVWFAGCDLWVTSGAPNPACVPPAK